jgi:hypothetical protein
VINPLMVNVALHGLTCSACCHSRQQAEQVKAQLAEWLAPRGLAFNQDKTRIVHLTEGFDFLGFNVRRDRNGKLLIKPSDAAVGRLRARLADEVRAPRLERGGGHRRAQPRHPGSGVQQDLQRAGRLRVGAHLAVGQAHPQR